jgi:hypothetical protein
MERIVLIAPDGKYYTDGEMYGKELYLAEGVDGSDFYLIDESELPPEEAFSEATEKDYLEALGRFGV